MHFWIFGARYEKQMLPCKSKKRVKSAEDNIAFPLLDLPELVLESILRQLSPYSLCQLAQTCRNLRKMCRSDEIWEPLYDERWGKIAGMNTFILWKCMLFRKHARICARAASLRMRPLRCIQPFPRPSSKLTAAELVIRPKEAFVNLYWQLECGEFWFPGQVFSREVQGFSFCQTFLGLAPGHIPFIHIIQLRPIQMGQTSLGMVFWWTHGHVEFMMSCYDADLKYDRNSDTFCARYLPHSARSLVMEDGISWKRIRKLPIVTSPSELYIPDVLEELRPGDHIEVQWKRSPSLPYGWWYGMVGHGDNCQSENQNCRCHLDEMVWLEFRQYSTGSRWRRTRIRRNRAPEIGSKLDGIYGGIRKLNNKEDISAWLRMWPKEPL